MTLVIELSEAEAQILRALAKQRGTDDAGALRDLIAGAGYTTLVSRVQEPATVYDAEIVEENGIKVLTGRNVEVEDWRELINSDRQARIDSLSSR
jgi:hypothetical protein